MRRSVVRDDPAQMLYTGTTCVQLQRAALTQRAVVDFGAAQQAYLVGCQALPAAQALQQPDAGVGEGNFSAIGCRIGQLLGALQLQHRGAQARLRQGAGERKSDRAAADDEHVRGHGGIVMGTRVCVGMAAMVTVGPHLAHMGMGSELTLSSRVTPRTARTYAHPLSPTPHTCTRFCHGRRPFGPSLCQFELGQA